MEHQELETVRKAIAVAADVGLLTSPQFQSAAQRLQVERGLPPDWNIVSYAHGKYLEGGLGGRAASTVVGYEPQPPQVVLALQHVFDQTYRKVYTRDRRGAPIPDAFRILEVHRVMNDQVWREYTGKREEVRANVGGQVPPNQVPGGAQTMNALLAHEGAMPRLDTGVNECWLFHGTNREAASGIAENDFRLDMSGSNAGTLYGKGIYLAENATKSDEYGEGPKGPAGFPCEMGYEAPRPPPGKPLEIVYESYILVCRSMLGRVRYTDERKPDPDDLQSRSMNGEYESVIGDRLKISKTFREFIVYHDDHVYPEYVIKYERVFFHEIFKEVYKQMSLRKRQGCFNGATEKELTVLKSMWDIYGMPNHGRINKWQLLDLLVAIDQTPENDAEDLDATFAEWNTSGSGYISGDEFIAEIQQRVKDGHCYYE
jgi:hypothetical protein